MGIVHLLGHDHIQVLPHLSFMGIVPFDRQRYSYKNSHWEVGYWTLWIQPSPWQRCQNDQQLRDSIQTWKWTRGLVLHVTFDSFEQFLPPDIVWYQNDSLKLAICACLNIKKTPFCKLGVCISEIWCWSWDKPHQSWISRIYHICFVWELKPGRNTQSKKRYLRLCTGKYFEDCHINLKPWCRNRCWKFTEPKNIACSRYVTYDDFFLPCSFLHQ